MLVFAYVNTSTYSLIPMYLSYSQIKRPILSHTNIFSLYQAGCTIIHEHLYTYIWTQTHSIPHIYEYAHTFMHMLTPSHKDTLVHLVTLNIKQIYSHTQTDTYTIHSQTHADAEQSKLWTWSHTHIYSHTVYTRGFLIAQLVKNLPAMQEASVWFLGQEDWLEKR